MQAEEFLTANTEAVRADCARALAGITMEYLPQSELNLHVSSAIGIIRTGELAEFGTIILESA